MSSEVSCAVRFGWLWREAPRFQEAAVNPDGWQLRLATVGIDDNKGTAVSMTLIYRTLYVVNTVQVCGGVL